MASRDPKSSAHTLSDQVVAQLQLDLLRAKMELTRTDYLMAKAKLEQDLVVPEECVIEVAAVELDDVTLSPLDAVPFATSGPYDGIVTIYSGHGDASRSLSVHVRHMGLLIAVLQSLEGTAQQSVSPGRPF